MLILATIVTVFAFVWLLVVSRSFRIATAIIACAAVVAGVGLTGFVWWSSPDARPPFANTMLGQPWLNDPIIPACTPEQIKKIDAGNPFNDLVRGPLKVPGTKEVCVATP